MLGDGSRESLAKDLSQKVDHPGLIDMAGKTSLVELAAILKQAAAGVGPDSGPGHLAAAVGTPFVSIFGPTSPGRTAPFGCEDLVVTSALDCAPCYKKRCPYRHNACMVDIETGQVIDKLSGALAMRRPG
jgi:ADP-heptose:LPS heptosyltransferase